MNRTQYWLNLLVIAVFLVLERLLTLLVLISPQVPEEIMILIQVGAISLLGCFFYHEFKSDLEFLRKHDVEQHKAEIEDMKAKKVEE